MTSLLQDEPEHFITLVHQNIFTVNRLSHNRITINYDIKNECKIDFCVYLYLYLRNFLM